MSDLSMIYGENRYAIPKRYQRKSWAKWFRERQANSYIARREMERVHRRIYEMMRIEGFSAAPSRYCSPMISQLLRDAPMHPLNRFRMR